MVTCNGKLSTEQSITIGVPQCSTLGPVLFLVYVNDIVQHVHNGSYNLFADDSIFYTTGKTIKEVTDSLQLVLNEVAYWYYINKLSVNASKSNTMLLNGKRKIADNLEVNLDGQKIKRVREIFRCIR